MRSSWFVLLAACGRVGFDVADDGGDGGTGGSGSSTCSPVPGCPQAILQVGLGSSGVGTQVITEHGLSSTTCGSGVDNPDAMFMIVPKVRATLTLTVTPSSTLIYLQDGCCGGSEFACGTSQLTVQREAGQGFVVVLEDTPGTMVMLDITTN